MTRFADQTENAEWLEQSERDYMIKRLRRRLKLFRLMIRASAGIVIKKRLIRADGAVQNVVTYGSSVMVSTVIGGAALVASQNMSATQIDGIDAVIIIAIIVVGGIICWMVD